MNKYRVMEQVRRENISARMQQMETDSFGHL